MARRGRGEDGSEVDGESRSSTSLSSSESDVARVGGGIGSKIGNQVWSLEA